MLFDFFIRAFRSVQFRSEKFFTPVMLDMLSHIEYKDEGAKIKHYLDPKFKLTEDEKSQIKQKYGKIIKPIGRGFDFFHAMKCLDRFDPNYLPACYYYPTFVNALNSAELKKIVCNKSLLKNIYENDLIRHPYTPVRTIGGIYVNDDNKPISANEAARILMSHDGKLIFKPSTDTSRGAGVKVIEESERDEFIKMIKENSVTYSIGNRDFVVQSLVKQSADTAIFNPSSLNCMRVSTLNLNGEVSILSKGLKCGGTNSVVDNLASGRHGVMVEIDAEGRLAPYGFYGNGERCYDHNGISFEGHRINAFDKVLAAALSLHKDISSCKIIGWDIALDENDCPVLIEGNVNYPGIIIEQMCSGPIFGDRTDEVIAYIADIQKYKKWGG